MNINFHNLSISEYPAIWNFFIVQRYLQYSKMPTKGSRGTVNVFKSKDPSWKLKMNIQWTQKEPFDEHRACRSHTLTFCMPGLYIQFLDKKSPHKLLHHQLQYYKITSGAKLAVSHVIFFFQFIKAQNTFIWFFRKIKTHSFNFFESSRKD